MEDFVSKKSIQFIDEMFLHDNFIYDNSKVSSKVAYPVDTTVQITRLLEIYSVEKKPIPVSFRKLVPWLKVGNRATHYLHPYPAKLFPQIAHFFLASEFLSKKGATVLDPFSGSGTVALETVLSGRNALYSDQNPFARLITKSKVIPLNTDDLESLLPDIRTYFKKTRFRQRPDVVNLDLWYSKKAINSLTRLQKSIETVCPEEFKDYLWIIFSSTCKKVSNANPRFNVPVRLKKLNLETGERELVPNKHDDIWKVFEDTFKANLKRQTDLTKYYTSPMKVKCVGTDARALVEPDSDLPLNPEHVDLIITSPPYAGAQKYIRASSLSLGWLGLCHSANLKLLETGSIGREHFPKKVSKYFKATDIEDADRLLKKIHKINPLRACIASHYLIEMRLSLKEMMRVLKPGGHIVLVIGNNKICGHDFLSSDYLSEMLSNAGAELMLSLVDTIPSRTLITKRAKTASIINTETIHVFKKPGN